MVKTTGPAVSQEAHGKLADVLIFMKTKKSATVKKHATPSNPKSPAQLAIRAMIKFLSQSWQTLTPLQQATWNTPAFIEDIPAYHAYVKNNMERWRTFRGPGKTYPVPDAGPIAGSVYLELFPGVENINTRLTSGGGLVPWGYIVWRQTADFNPAKIWMTVAVIPRITPAWNYWRDTPLKSGTYWYRKGNFTEDGQIRQYGGSQSATVP